MVNSNLSTVRNTPRGKFFPNILINPKLKDDFTRELEQDQVTVRQQSTKWIRNSTIIDRSLL